MDCVRARPRAATCRPGPPAWLDRGRHRRHLARRRRAPSSSRPTTRSRARTASTWPSSTPRATTLVPVGRSVARGRPVRAPRSTCPQADLRLVNAGDLTFAAVKPDPTSLRLMLDRVQRAPRPARPGARGRHRRPAAAARRARAARRVRRADPRACRTETSPALVEPFLEPGAPGRRPVGAGRRVPRPARPRWPTPPSALVDVPDAPPGGAAHARRHPPPPTRTGRSCEAAADRGDRPRPGVADGRAPRRARRLRRGRGHAGCSSPTPTPTPACARLAVLAARPDVEAKEEVWRAFFVDYAVPASRETLVLGCDVLAARPGRAARAVHPPLPRGAAHAQGRPAQPGPRDPGDVPARRRRRVVPRRAPRRAGRGRASLDAPTPATSSARTRSCSAGSCRPAASEPAAR